MAKWFKKIISNFRANRITLTKIREAYLIRDSKFLINAYKYGHNHLKRTAVGYIGEINNQENYNFLINEMQLVQEVKLKSYIYLSIMNLALNESIIITDDESEYLNQNLDLLENIGYVTTQPKDKKPKQTPITFRNRLKDHLGILEQMKKDFETY
ncbi:MAG: hypothetical protein MK105_15595 [Crocinitomicaceae bacterium]|nr:hypothetical protein [Crocinitomicaceae bacterium]